MAVSLNFIALLPAGEAVALLSRRLEIVQARLDELHATVIEDAEGH